MKDYNKLDTAAKLFPSVSNNKNSSVFRISLLLTEEIDPHTLQLAVNIIYERYSLFFLRLRRGVFWHYFDTNYTHFTVEEEHATPCQSIIATETQGHIIKVLYYNHRISVEAFHAVTDGSGVIEFLKSLTYYYLCIRHGMIDPQGKVLLFNETEKNDENSFAKHFGDFKQEKQPRCKKLVNSFRIKGKRFSKDGHSVITGVLSVRTLKNYCKSHHCTITTLLIAQMIQSIYLENQRHTHSQKPIVIAVPVNLRKLFDSQTLKNFFGVVHIQYEMTADTNFDLLLQSVTDQLHQATRHDHLQSISKHNVKLSNNIICRHTPLIVKNMVMPIGFNLMGELKKTTSVSNVGCIDLPEGMLPYVEHAEVLCYPTTNTPLTCTVCSLEDKLSITFTRSIREVAIIRSFFTSLSSRINADLAIYSNMWGDQHEQM